ILPLRTGELPLHPFFSIVFQWLDTSHPASYGDAGNYPFTPLFFLIKDDIGEKFEYIYLNLLLLMRDLTASGLKELCVTFVFGSIVFFDDMLHGIESLFYIHLTMIHDYYLTNKIYQIILNYTLQNEKPIEPKEGMPPKIKQEPYYRHIKRCMLAHLLYLGHTCDNEFSIESGFLYLGFLIGYVTF
ncbi:hypothetical protein ACJX0J_009345, partial [Zea mays]